MWPYTCFTQGPGQARAGHTNSKLLGRVIKVNCLHQIFHLVSKRLNRALGLQEFLRIPFGFFFSEFLKCCPHLISQLLKKNAAARKLESYENPIVQKWNFAGLVLWILTVWIWNLNSWEIIVGIVVWKFSKQLFIEFLGIMLIFVLKEYWKDVE